MTTEEIAWFEKWFHSDYYLKLYSHRNKVEAEACIDIIQRATQQFPLENTPLRALDVATGPGRHAISLAKRGFEVTAIDISTTLLQHAYNEARKATVEIQFLRSDMREIDFHNEFDLVVQLFSSFGYFDTPEEDMEVLKRIRQSLRDVGSYALDLMNERHIRKALVPRSVKNVDDTKIIEERSIVDSRVIKKITIPKNGAHLEFKESVRLYSPEHIERMLREAGFLPTHWFGDYAGLPFDPERSNRMIVISKVA